MKFSMSAANLKSAIKKIGVAVSSKSGIAAISTIHASLAAGVVTLTTTDLHITICYTSITATIEGEGVMLIPYNEIKNLLALLSGDVNIYLENESIMMSCGLDVFCLGKGMDTKEFPKLPRIADGRVFKINERIFSFITVAAIGVSSDENKPAMMHVLLDLAKDGANIVSTDGNSLYTKRIAVEIEIEEPEKLLIPSSVAKIIESMAIPSIGFNKNHCLFSTPDLKVYFKRLDATYPDYRQIIPVHNTNVKVSVDKLDAAMAKALVVNHDLSFNGIELNINPTNIEVVSAAAETGMSAACFVEAEAGDCQVKSLKINGRIFKRLLSQGQAHQVDAMLDMSVSAANKAISIKIAGNDSLTMVVMPIAKTK